VFNRFVLLNVQCAISSESGARTRRPNLIAKAGRERTEVGRLDRTVARSE
jgi:hypothetical protein